MSNLPTTYPTTDHRRNASGDESKAERGYDRTARAEVITFLNLRMKYMQPRVPIRAAFY